MSILSQLRSGKITFAQAAEQVEQWVSGLIAKSPPAVHDAINAVAGDIRQAASDAVTVGDTLAGPLINVAADAVGTAFASAATAYLGPLGGVVTPAALDAIDRIRDGVKAELDTLALQMKAQLAGRRAGLVGPHGRMMLRLLLVVAICGVAIGFVAGWRIHDWRDGAAIAGQSARVVRVVERQAAVSQGTAVHDQAAQDHIRIVTKTLVEQVPAYVTLDDDLRYPLPFGFVRLHDAAAAGVDLSAPAAGAPGSDDAPSGVAASDAAHTIALNYGDCHADQQRLSDLQTWLRDQGLAK